MKHNLDDQMAAEHLMQVIKRALDELNHLYPSQGPFSAEAALLTAGILMLIDQAGRARAAQAVRSLAQEIENGGFDCYTKEHRQVIQ